MYHIYYNATQKFVVCELSLLVLWPLLFWSFGGEMNTFGQEPKAAQVHDTDTDTWYLDLRYYTNTLRLLHRLLRGAVSGHNFTASQSITLNFDKI